MAVFRPFYLCGSSYQARKLRGKRQTTVLASVCARFDQVLKICPRVMLLVWRNAVKREAALMNAPQLHVGKE